LSRCTIPKRARIGGVSMPNRVVAPISANFSTGIVIVWARGPSDKRMSIRKSSIAG
jgi:hypothetical protein